MKSTAQRPAMPKEVEALRTSLDARLTALEKALADPKQHGLLESLILDLARVATQEADATARQAVADAQKTAQQAAQKAIEAARADVAESLEAEKAEAAALRTLIEDAKAALKQAEAALKEERRASETAGREAAAAHRELTALRESVEQEQAARAAERRELEAALTAAEADRARATALEQEVAQVRAQAETERAALANQVEEQRRAVETERAAAAGLRQSSAELEGKVRVVLTELATARQAAEAANRDVEGARAELDAMRREAESARGERDAAQRDLESARRELDSIRHDAEARTKTLSQSQGEQEQLLKSAQDAARGAEARAEQLVRERDDAAARIEQAIRERDAVQDEAAELKRQLELAEGTIREHEALKRELQAAHEARDAAEVLEAARNSGPDAEMEIDPETVVDLTSVTKEEERQLAIEQRIRGLELALRDAETRAESAEAELDLLRRPATREIPVEPAPALASVPAIAAQEGQEQFRGPARAAKRVQFKGETDIQIDNTPGKLVDLSLTGAQVLTPSAMKPNRLVKVSLPLGDSSIACKAKVMWSRLEPRAGQLWYRAGVAFTSADQIAIEAFLNSHPK